MKSKPRRRSIAIYVMLTTFFALMVTMVTLRKRKSVEANSQEVISNAPSGDLNSKQTPSTDEQ